jgi:RNA polymerase sigma-70 factor, ECF subfamily
MTVAAGGNVEGSAATAPNGDRRAAGAGPVTGRRGEPRTSRDVHLCDLVRVIGDDRDDPAFIELFHDLAPRVRRMLLRHGTSWALAEELTQETMLSVWRHAKTFDRRRASVATWALTIARNERIDHIRSMSRRPEAASEPLEPTAPAAEPDGEHVLHFKQPARFWITRSRPCRESRRC